MFDPQKPKVEKPVDWKRLGKLFAPYWRQEAQVLLCILVISVLGLLPPLFTMWLIDKAIPSHDFRAVVLIVFGMIVSALLASLVGVYQGYLNSVVSEGIMRDLRSSLMAHMHRMPLHFFASTKTGEIMNRVANDVDTVNGVISMTLVSIVTNLIIIVTTLATILFLDWRLAILSVVIIPFMIFPLWPVGRKLYDIRKVTRKKRDEMHALTQETLSISGILLLLSAAGRSNPH
ncbi:MAG TPA: ABC transporter transmembrane domain-containing protein [Candidatus Obscuribacterales bacterium]